MDPAGPLFRLVSEEDRLAITDAQLVIKIH